MTRLLAEVQKRVEGIEDFGAIFAKAQEENSIKSQMSPHIMDPPPDHSDHGHSPEHNSSENQSPEHNSSENQSPEDQHEASETQIEGQPTSSDHLAARKEPM